MVVVGTWFLAVLEGFFSVERFFESSKVGLYKILKPPPAFYLRKLCSAMVVVGTWFLAVLEGFFL
jgi:hypothetical protein